MKTYFYTTEEIGKDATSCGLKLSLVTQGTVSIYGQTVPCFVTFLHPADCPEEFRTAHILKLSVEPHKAFVAEGMFTDQRYVDSIIPVQDYRLGLYRKPRCLVISSVFPEQIERYDPYMDEPLLYESSQQLYRDTVMSRVQESELFCETALRAFYTQEAEAGRCVRVEEQGTVLFLSPQDGQTIFAFNNEE